MVTGRRSMLRWRLRRPSGLLLLLVMMYVHLLHLLVNRRGSDHSSNITSDINARAAHTLQLAVTA